MKTDINDVKIEIVRMKKSIIDMLQKMDNIDVNMSVTLTYGYVPPFRSWLSNDCDKWYMYEATEEEKEEIHELVDRVFEEIGTETDYHIEYDESDGTVVLAVRDGFNQFGDVDED